LQGRNVIVVDCDIVGVRNGDAYRCASAVWYARRLHLAVSDVVKLDTYTIEAPTAKVDVPNREVCVCIAYQYSIVIGHRVGGVRDIPVLYDIRVGTRTGSGSNSIGDRESCVAIYKYNGVKLVVG